MGFRRKGLSISVVTATAAALLLLTPGPRSEHLEKPGHDHDASVRVAIEAVHTTLPAHLDASSSARESICSACFLHDRTLVPAAPAPVVASLPSGAAGLQLGGWIPSKPLRGLDTPRGPPNVL